MNIWIALVTGLILGWLIEWLIDWVFWRRGIDEFYATETELRGQLAEAQATIDDLRRQLEAAGSRTAASPSTSGSSTTGSGTTGSGTAGSGAAGSGKPKARAEKMPAAPQQETARR
jgi:hypothetical protein